MTVALASLPARNGNGSQPVRPRILNYSEMIALPEPTWLVENVIQEHGSALLFGPSNAFKSFIAGDIGNSVACGRDWHGNAVKQGRVLYLLTEGAHGFARRRIPGWFDHYDVADTHRANVHLYPSEIALDSAADVKALIADMSQIGSFALVVLDIFGGTMAGSEIEDKTARQWVNGTRRIIRETGASILTVAHTGWQDQTRARMHTHFWGSFDNRLCVEGDRVSKTATLRVERHKEEDSNGAWGFRLEKAGRTLVPTLDDTVEVAKADGKARGPTAQERTALNALDDAVEASGTRKKGPNWPAKPIVAISDWKHHCERHGLASTGNADAFRKAFNRARENLKKKGLIYELDGYVWRTDGTRDTGRDKGHPL